MAQVADISANGEDTFKQLLQSKGVSDDTIQKLIENEMNSVYALFVSHHVYGPTPYLH